MSRHLIQAVAAFMLLAVMGDAFLLKGVLPNTYSDGDDLWIKVNSLTSVSQVMPMDWYSLPWCQIPVEERKKARRKRNLGETLWGDQIEPSLYKVKAGSNNTCSVVCEVNLIPAETDLLAKRIEEKYRGNMVLDGLPLGEEGSNKHSRLSSSVLMGFPIGIPKKHSATDETLVHNHLQFTIQYHVQVPESTYIPFDDDEKDQIRIVGFQVTPLSVDHTSNPCSDKFVADRGSPLSAKSQTILYTYSVQWIESSLEWSTRWDVYLKSTKAEARVHWFSIVNALLVVLLLTAIIAIILIRALRKDLARYNDPESLEEDREETGWKLVHGDVFRKPEGAGLLAVYAGTGAQLFFMCFFTLIFACLGFLSPQQRGSLMTFLIFIFVLLGSYAGYTTARLAKYFKMRSWKIIFATGLFFPGANFTLYLILNFVHWGNKASSATPFTTILTLMALWFLVSLPLVLLGGALGYRKDTIEMPRKTNTIARTIPPQPTFLNYPQSILVPGILPFGAAFIESVFILSSVWQGRIYYVFGFLALVFLIVAITCAEATIVMVYFQLLHLDYRWWWRSFLTSGSYAFWLFGYSIFYYFTALSIRSLWSSLLYFSYMFMVCHLFFVLTGSIGFGAAFLFVKKIYGSIKID